MAGNSSTYYLGTTPTEGLGNSPRYWYALRRNEDGELFLVRSDQIIDRDAYELNIPGPPEEDFDNFIVGTDYLDGIDVEHELVKENMFYPQYKWDDRSLFYYVDNEGMFIVRINKGYAYPDGISS
jgi:hypothetical protein